MKRVMMHTLIEILDALKNNCIPRFQGGVWKVEGWLGSFIGRLFSSEEKRISAFADDFSAQLDEFEKYPILFSQDGSEAGQLFDVLDCFEIGKSILEKLSNYPSQACMKSAVQLRRRLLALNYRLEAANLGMSPSSVQQDIVNTLKFRVSQWKKDHEVIADVSKKISERDLLQIQTTSRYPDFVELLLSDEALWKSYVLWTFRDGNQAAIFIEYPRLQKILVESNLNGRIGRISENDLKIVRRPIPPDGSHDFEKIVTLPFDGIDTNILDPDLQVCFKGNYCLSISDVFEIFKNKTYAVGNLEYLAHGVTNWNVHHWGYWDADKQDYVKIDLGHHQWWEQLPIFEICSRDELFDRYGRPVDGVEWIVAATATRGSRTLDYENTHAFLEVAIPWGDGRYAIYDFGKYAMKFPSSFFEGVSVFCHNLHATLAFPDENVFYSHREQSYQAYSMSREQGFTLMGCIKDDMIKSQLMNFVYQIESDNCAKWVYHQLESVFGPGNLPNMFRMQLLDTEPHSPVGAVFGLIKKLPESIQIRTLMFMHLFLGAANGTWIIEEGRWVCKSLTRHIFWRTGEIFLPALLHKKIEEGAFESLGERKLLYLRGVRLFFLEKLKRYTNSFGQSLRFISKRIFGLSGVGLASLLAGIFHNLYVRSSRRFLVR